MLPRRIVLTTGLLLAPLAPAVAQNASAPNEQDLRALVKAYTLYLGAGHLKDVCAQRDPASAAKVKQAYAAWLRNQNLGTFEAQMSKKLGATNFSALRQQMSGNLNVLDAALTKLGPPSQSCPALATQFSSAMFNVRQQVPNLAALLGTGDAAVATNGAAKTTGSSAGQNGSGALANITLYSVAQLSSLMAQTVGPLEDAGSGAQEAAGLKKLQSLGKVIAVTGTVQRSRSLTQADDRRATKYDVYCYDMYEDADDPPEGQVTVVGRVRNFDALTGPVLEQCIVLSAAQSAQLKKSSLGVVDAGWRFKEQPAEKFLVAAGQGLKDSDILGVYMKQSSSGGVGGSVIVTFPVSLFLKDGTVYNDPYWAPNSFNYRLSRKLEPQKWGKWTRQGKNFLIKWGSGETQTFKVQGAPAPLPAGTRLSGAFETISGGGNTALGGDVMVASGSNYTFRPDGTFTGGRFGASSVSGEQSGGAATAVSSASGGGTYSVSGYGLTLRGANGQESRLFFARYDQDLLYIGNSAYTPDH